MMSELETAEVDGRATTTSRFTVWARFRRKARIDHMRNDTSDLNVPNTAEMEYKPPSGMTTVRPSFHSTQWADPNVDGSNQSEEDEIGGDGDDAYDDDWFEWGDEDPLLLQFCSFDSPENDGWWNGTFIPPDDQNEQAETSATQTSEPLSNPAPLKCSTKTGSIAISKSTEQTETYETPIPLGKVTNPRVASSTIKKVNSSSDDENKDDTTLDLHGSDSDELSLPFDEMATVKMGSSRRCLSTKGATYIVDLKGDNTKERNCLKGLIFKVKGGRGFCRRRRKNEGNIRAKDDALKVFGKKKKDSTSTMSEEDDGDQCWGLVVKEEAPVHDGLEMDANDQVLQTTEEAKDTDLSESYELLYYHPPLGKEELKEEPAIRHSTKVLFAINQSACQNEIVQLSGGTKTTPDQHFTEYGNKQNETKTNDSAPPIKFSPTIVDLLTEFDEKIKEQEIKSGSSSSLPFDEKDEDDEYEDEDDNAFDMICCSLTLCT